ncbi:MAG: LysR family transcriptional regulator [Woeseiaceae bacterium]
MRISPRDLEAVRLVAENGSLTATARLMHVSQPAISQRLAGLQDRLGSELFLRRHGRMVATPVARRLAAAAVSMDRVMQHALDDVREIAEQRRQQLRVTTQCYTCYRWLSFVIRDLLRSHPELVVDVIPEAIEDAQSAVERDEVDIAIVSRVTEPPPGHVVELFRDELFAVMRDDHRFAGRSYLTPANFADEPLILYAGARHAFIDDVLTPAGVEPRRLRQVRMTEAIVELARAGQGIAVLAGWVLNDQVSDAGLARVRIGRGGYRRRWHALINQHCNDELATAFVERVRRNSESFRHDGWRRLLEEN